MYIIKLKNRWTGNILVYPKSPTTPEELKTTLSSLPYSKINWSVIVVPNSNQNES